MNTLKQFKQKGRILRKLLATAFDTEVKLSMAYEAIAVMEGCNDWNEFSARLVEPSSSVQVPPVPAFTPMVLPAIRAIFRTVDGKAQAEFDASSWFALASEFDIAGLMEEKPRMSPVDYELSYGGKNGYSDSVAEFVAQTNKDVRDVYTYIGALADVGGDCGGSDCYIDAHGVQAWLSARAKATSVSASAKAVPDVELGAATNAARLTKVCALVQLEAQRRHAASDYRPTLASDIEAAFRDLKVSPSGESGEYAASAFELVRQAFAPNVLDTEPMYETMPVFVAMMQDYADEYDVPDEVPEWLWVQKNAAFSHRDNGKEGGVWEFMVNVECSENAEGMPESLKPLFARARLHKAGWVMFHQGT